VALQLLLNAIRASADPARGRHRGHVSIRYADGRVLLNVRNDAAAPAADAA
jgi:hypothetical protein